VPLRVKWAAMMAAIVAVVMGISATLITQRQVAALMSQAIDYGASTARFMAAQNAASVLGEEWEAVEVIVEKIMKTGDYERITVADANGVVRAASDPKLVGQPYKAAGQRAPGHGATRWWPARYVVNGEPCSASTCRSRSRNRPPAAWRWASAKSR
jgi:sensor histidine kinase regulating citrate/malate metabolism